MGEHSLPETLTCREKPKIVLAGHGFFEKLELTNREKILILSSPQHLKSGAIPKLLKDLSPRVTKAICDISPNPTLTTISRVVTESQSTKWDTILAFGGGSVIDTAKIVAMHCKNFQEPDEFDLDSLQLNPKILRTCRLIVVPTTTGTGSEVTPFATVWDEIAQMKRSVCSTNLYPDVAILDPDLVMTSPFELRLYSCLDATAHCMETLWNKNRTSESDFFAKSGLQIIEKNIYALRTHKWNKEIAGQMQIAAVFGGLAISISRTALSHSISYPLTLHLGIPHGLAVGFSLSAIYESLTKDELKFVEASFSMTQLVSQLKLMELHHHMARYASSTEVLSFADRMLDSDRAQNFVKPIDRELIASIIKKSLQSGQDTALT